MIAEDPASSHVRLRWADAAAATRPATSARSSRPTTAIARYRRARRSRRRRGRPTGRAALRTVRSAGPSTTGCSAGGDVLSSGGPAPCRGGRRPGEAGVDNVIHAVLLRSGDDPAVPGDDDVVLVVAGRDEDQGLHVREVEAGFVVEVQRPTEPTGTSVSVGHNRHNPGLGALWAPRAPRLRDPRRPGPDR